MASTREQKRAQYRLYKERFPERIQQWNKQTKLRGYGLTVDEFDEMVRQQEGVCLICERPPDERHTRLSVDHCHETDAVRGLLCYYCNLALGLFEDDLCRLERAVLYLDGNAPRPEGHFGARPREFTSRQLTHRKYHLKKNYGLSWDAFNALMERFNGRCGICEQAESELNPNRPWLCVDHCHAGDQVRGLLCTPCNAALGHLRDDPQLIVRAISYLESHRAMG